MAPSTNSPSPPQRCHYEILGLPRTCTPEEIRSAYKKLALQLHPDKLLHTSISEEAATAAFQELRNAYEVLSDPKERAWYDSHRTKILTCNASSSSSSFSFSGDSLNLWPYFSNSAFSGFGDTRKGFFKVYGDVFAKVYANEVRFAEVIDPTGEKISVREAPVMGNADCDYAQVSAFYDYWLVFSTVMDFSWVDQYRISEAPNRKVRRLAEEENMKLRKAAKREFNEMVRGLAAFVKKRDKRVIERRLLREKEEKKRKEAELARKKEAEREKLEKARIFKEPEWAKAKGEELLVEDESDHEQENVKEVKEFYCIVCSKKFKSEKQWKNHEQSKKHKMKVMEFGDDQYEVEIDDNGGSVEDELREEFLHSASLNEDDADANASEVSRQNNGANRGVVPSSIENDRERDGNGSVDGDEDGGDDEESFLEAMIKGQRLRKNGDSSDTSYSLKEEDNTTTCPGASSNHVGAAGTCSSDRKKDGGKHDEEANGDQRERDEGGDISEVLINGEDKNRISESSRAQVSGAADDGPNEDSCKSSEVDDTTGASRRNTTNQRNQSSSNESFHKKAFLENESNAKKRASSKGKKGKSASKPPHLACETCTEEFDSRNQLFMHLSKTGHASLKSR